MEPAVAFGRVLRRLRLEAGLTQEELGFDASLRRTYISVLELGRQQPSLKTILKLAKALNTTGKEIVGAIESEIAAGRRRS